MKIQDIQINSLYRNSTITIYCEKDDLKELMEFRKNSNIEFGKNYTIKIEKKKFKRSLDANAYCWILCDKIAADVNSTKEEIYRIHIQRVGKFEDVAITDAGLDDLIKGWQHGDGWIAEVLPECKLKGCKKVRLYYGSSSYTVEEMARLIDDIVDEAHNLGIETIQPEELQRLKGMIRNEE